MSGSFIARPEGKWIVGEEAILIALHLGVDLESLEYPPGRSPQFHPKALRYAPQHAYLDRDRLDLIQQHRLCWLVIGVNYFHRCMDLTDTIDTDRED